MPSIILLIQHSATHVRENVKCAVESIKADIKEIMKTNKIQINDINHNHDPLSKSSAKSLNISRNFVDAATCLLAFDKNCE